METNKLKTKISSPFSNLLWAISGYNTSSWRQFLDRSVWISMSCGLFSDAYFDKTSLVNALNLRWAKNRQGSKDIWHNGTKVQTASLANKNKNKFTNLLRDLLVASKRGGKSSKAKKVEKSNKAKKVGATVSLAILYFSHVRVLSTQQSTCHKREEHLEVLYDPYLKSLQWRL